jgi:hypothetical protein
MEETNPSELNHETVDEALHSLLYLRSFEAYKEWLASHGPKERSAVLRILLRKRSERHGGLSYAAWLDLLLDTGADPLAAWQRREAEAQAVENFMKGLDDAMEGITDALSRGEVEEALDGFDKLIAHGRELRAGGQVGFLQKLRAGVLQFRQQGSRAENLEEAIEALNEATGLTTSRSAPTSSMRRSNSSPRRIRLSYAGS